jgi:hypothetical protein
MSNWVAMYIRRNYKRIAISAVAILLLLTVLFKYYKKHYAYPKAGEDYFIYLNPFRPTQGTFDRKYSEFRKALVQADTAQAKKIGESALAYRGSFNEKQYRRIFSDGNDYQDYVMKQTLKYAGLYQMAGLPDSAMSALAPGLMFLGRNDYSLEKYFFSIAKEKYGKDSLKRMIASGINHVKLFKVNNGDYYHYEFYYSTGKFKLPLDEADTMLARTNQTALLDSLYKRYELQ